MISAPETELFRLHSTVPSRNDLASMARKANSWGVYQVAGHDDDDDDGDDD